MAMSEREYAQLKRDRKAARRLGVADLMFALSEKCSNIVIACDPAFKHHNDGDVGHRALSKGDVCVLLGFLRCLDTHVIQETRKTFSLMTGMYLAGPFHKDERRNKSGGYQYEHELIEAEYRHGRGVAANKTAPTPEAKP